MSRWGRRYPPLLVILAATLLAIFTLPSALNLPQANPGRIAEYAPLPGRNPNAPPQGNLAALGLGAGGQAEGGGAPVSPPAGGTAQPTTMDCVGSPPRQTEDPMSPPCVPYFTGSNGGATYPGVTADQVRIVLYTTNNQAHTGSQGQEIPPHGQCFDLFKPAAGPEYYYLGAARIWQAYFNTRYQTYGRRVHFWVCFASVDSNDNESQQMAVEDAASNFAAIHPFADVVDDFSGTGIDYIKQMAQRGVLSFGTSLAEPASVYSAYPGLIWSFEASIEEHAQQFASFVCTEVVRHPVSFSGNLQDQGKPRKLGLLSSSDPSKPAFSEFARLAEQKIRACGGDVAATATFPQEGYLVSVDQKETQDAANNMAAFQSAGVTTVIWEEGMDDSQDMPDAAKLGWFPEWVLAGDSQIEDIVYAKWQDRSELQHAWALTNEPLLGPFHTYDCYQAAAQTDRSLPDSDTAVPCQLYPGLRQLFTGIQVAGPHLDPQTIDQGFHAIPGNPSPSPKLPACFYGPGDYTCVKDAAAMWYDANAVSSYSDSPGCWRAASGGVRYLAGAWPGGDLTKLQRPASDPCNNYDSGRYEDPSPGPDNPPAQ